MEGSKNLGIHIVIKKCNAPEMQSELVSKMKIIADILQVTSCVNPVS